MPVLVEVVDHPDTALLGDLNSLLPQLSTTAKVMSLAGLTSILGNDGATLIVARTTRVVGALTLVVFQLPTGMRARIEDDRG